MHVKLLCANLCYRSDINIYRQVSSVSAIEIQMLLSQAASIWVHSPNESLPYYNIIAYHPLSISKFCWLRSCKEKKKLTSFDMVGGDLFNGCVDHLLRLLYRSCRMITMTTSQICHWLLYIFVIPRYIIITWKL